MKEDSGENHVLDHYGRDLTQFYERLSILKECHKSAKQYKLKFLFDALEVILEFQNLLPDYDEETHEITNEEDHHYWIYEGLLAELASKSKTSNERYRLGLLVNELVKNGSSRISAIKAVSEWFAVADTKCRSAFHEYQKFNLAYPKYINNGMGDIMIRMLIRQNKRPFPIIDARTTSAFHRILSEMEMDQKVRDRALKLAEEVLKNTNIKRAR